MINYLVSNSFPSVSHSKVKTKRQHRGVQLLFTIQIFLMGTGFCPLCRRLCLRDSRCPPPMAGVCFSLS